MSSSYVFSCFVVVLLFAAVRGQTTTPTYEHNIAEDFCRQCLVRDGIEPTSAAMLYADPLDCECYYNCFYQQEFVNGTYEYIVVGIRQCCNNKLLPDVGGRRLYFREDLQTCVWKFEGSCNDDPCMNDNVQYHLEGVQLLCLEYYQCTHGYSLKMCCPPFQVFNMSLDPPVCDEDDTCIQRCSAEGEEPEPPPGPVVVIGDECWDEFGVKRKSDPGAPFRYFTYDGISYLPRYCASGSIFVLESCRCSEEGEAWTHVGLPLDFVVLYLPFQVDTVDHSNNHLRVVTVGSPPHPSIGMFTYFNGNGFFEVPGAALLDIGTRMTMFFSFMFPCTPSLADGVEYGLLAGCMGTGDFYGSGRIFLGSDRRLYMNSEIGGAMFSFVTEPLNCEVWHTVGFMADGEFRNFARTLRISSDGTSDDSTGAFVGKVPWLTYCPMLIGAQRIDDPDSQSFFTGYMAMIFLYRDSMPDFVFEETTRIMNHFVNGEPVNLPEFLQL